MKKSFQTVLLSLAALLAMMPCTAAPATNQAGDVNGDGNVNIADVTSLIDVLLGGASQTTSSCADVNLDGSVNIADVTDLIDYLLTGIWQHDVQQNQTFVVGDVSFTMVAVEGGTFTMGATPEQGTDAYDREKPAHEVTLSDFSIGETEVTQALWVAVMGDNPSYSTGDLNLPVERVTWYDCQDFIAKLNEMTGQTFRLPTEAEWEYAARGGNKSRGYKYAGGDDIDEVAWYSGNSGEQSHLVATKVPNELGLYDMSGSVWEWCFDWCDTYPAEPQTNPTGPETGTFTVLRGGSWYGPVGYCRVSYRGYYMPAGISGDLGLRLVL
ncbi:MAG: SUMF1/EgtB/PvdO family nonheme iron enzyme [Muribaculaceae bacterium]|nr:SUMF1/EgtB/PvdO family nonheme iron enzyme [Muribaculaceae bacterium]MBQ7205655.1 SUMF1/EgtB/PvdO family nonheme iron enzyme [Muribaculaceae bacterium]